MSDSDALRELSRAMGVMEGTQTQILSMLSALQSRIGDHLNDDQAAFSAVRNMMNDQKETLQKYFDNQSTERNTRLDVQDKQLNELMRYVSWAKGASWPILGLLGLVGLVLVGVLVNLMQVLVRMMFK